MGPDLLPEECLTVSTVQGTRSIAMTMVDGTAIATYCSVL